MSESNGRGSRVWVVEVNRPGTTFSLSYAYHDEASARKKYREVQKKYRGTRVMYRIISPQEG